MVDIFDPSFEQTAEVELSDNRCSKGDDINLTAKDPTMKSVVIGIGWDLNTFETDTLDLDVSCFLLNKDEKTRVDGDFVFYNNMEASEGAIIHHGDSRTGAGEGDDESITVHLNNIPYDVQKVMFALSIYRGEEKEQYMGTMRRAYIRVLNESNNQEILRYEITEDCKGKTETGMLVASLNREGPKWHFEAVGEFVKGGLAEIASGYDIIVHTG